MGILRAFSSAFNYHLAIHIVIPGHLLIEDLPFMPLQCYFSKQLAKDLVNIFQKKVNVCHTSASAYSAKFVTCAFYKTS